MGKKTFFANDDIRVYPLDKSLETRWFVRYKLPNGKRKEIEKQYKRDGDNKKLRLRLDVQNK